MKPLQEVEAAKAIMTEAVEWSVMKWLGDKKRVRKAADEANAALDKLSKDIKATWPDALKAAYDEVAGHSGHSKGKAAPSEEMKKFALEVREADELAYKTRMEAEDIFDRAEKRLSTSMARDGCHKAIEGWNLHEKAIRLAESATRSKKSVA